MNYPDSINVPFRGKVFPCRLTHSVVFKAERDLGLNILYPGDPSIFKQPIAYQVACWIYALLLSTKLKNVTLDECIDATMGEDRERYMEILNEFIRQLNPALMEFHGIAKEEEPTAPLVESSGGETDGPPQEPPSDSSSSGT